PTHVFIGGSSGSLEGIVRCIIEKSPRAKIVLNAITLETIKEVLLAEEKGLLVDVEIIQAGISRAKKIMDYHMLAGQNPIYIVSAGAGGRRGREIQ
ncbi:MAG: bifunctional cobalt-precorrin-7 (C(5))-methyltransferase/cobalt-precorrin-6B (C(15))-methyltransferase, partial [Lachnospiraceae bacterium]|nr:bifunctional cobalt-precorrin-7 (C(5))-methyltransferase/cobalt-precorrin-6B (C(15))-methyltransferase [Lachnospiraceae bacterium]